jgi:hypothetical protein
MAKIAIIPPNLPFFFDFSCQTQDITINFLVPSLLSFILHKKSHQQRQ